MKVTDKFSIKRTALLIKQDIVGNIKSYSYGLLMIFLATLFIILVTMALYCLGGGGEFTSARMFSATIVNFMGGVFIYVMATRIFRNLQSKEGRASFFTLPALNVEKFICRSIIYVLFAYIAFYAAALAADLTKNIFVFIFRFDKSYYGMMSFVDFKTSFTFWEMISSEMGEYAGRLIYLSITSSFWMHSIYVLGGSFFRRHPFIKTTAILFAAFIIFTIFLSNMMFKLVDKCVQTVGEVSADMLNYSFLDYVSSIYYILLGFFIIFTIIHWVSAYKLFARKEIV